MAAHHRRLVGGEAASTVKFRCEKCNRQMDDKVETVWNFVTGWEKRREQGGTNHIALRTPQDTYCCNGCMQLLLAGLDPGQQALTV